MKQSKKPNHENRPGPALDQARIVESALALLDEAGIDDLSMRSLAAKLGVKAASLYWHVRDKDELLCLLADEICRPIREPDRKEHWQKRIGNLGGEYRRVLLAHRDAARVVANTGGRLGPQRLRLAEMVLAILLDAGLSHSDAAHAGLLLNDFVVMFVLRETAIAGPWTNPGARSAGSGADLSNPRSAAGQYPSLEALAAHLQGTDQEARFQFGVEVFQQGLASRLRASKRALSV
jgi:TetR/AcrR family tetracycline transcriptional repressor